MASCTLCMLQAARPHRASCILISSASPTMTQRPLYLFSFALQKAQEVLHLLHTLRKKEKCFLPSWFILSTSKSLRTCDLNVLNSMLREIVQLTLVGEERRLNYFMGYFGKNPNQDADATALDRTNTSVQPGAPATCSPLPFRKSQMFYYAHFKKAVAWSLNVSAHFQKQKRSQPTHREIFKRGPKANRLSFCNIQLVRLDDYQLNWKWRLPLKCPWISPGTVVCHFQSVPVVGHPHPCLWPQIRISWVQAPFWKECS